MKVIQQVPVTALKAQSSFAWNSCSTEEELELAPQDTQSAVRNPQSPRQMSWKCPNGWGPLRRKQRWQISQINEIPVIRRQEAQQECPEIKSEEKRAIQIDPNNRQNQIE
ncbi:uncharacterized protein LOC110184300 [Drosophila serrata]|uniref:uncharacterized protein LOC110184300 n=1 Tax=Drosophila serrata TaxID=7274 RepID=UPI000A1D24AA|nr:uncharacterized protein LOC110184300 [Drosophila serrata]